MTFEQVSLLAEIVTAFATGVTSIAAVGAILFARRQLRQDLAGAAYRSLLEKALEYPDFVCPDPRLVNTELETFNSNQTEFRRYESFVDLMLTTFEEMIKLPIDKTSESYILQWLSDHRTYLASDYFEKNFRQTVSGKLWEMIKESRKPPSSRT